MFNNDGELMEEDMNNIVNLAEASRALSDKQISLVRRTVAKECSNEEFDLFMEIARQTSLDPFRKQIFAVIYNADKPDKRQMVVMTSIDGMRAIAARCGDYRPADQAAEIVYDEAAISAETNPKGIVSAETFAYKRANDGSWFPVVGTALWEEFAPLVDEWEYNQEAGKRLPAGKVTLDKKSNFWWRMPTLMLTKCAEAQALRRGWPEDLSALYATEETDRSKVIDATASEVADQFAEDHRLKLIGHKDSIPFTMSYGGPIEWIPLGQCGDRIAALVDAEDVSTLQWWNEVNEESFKQFWARAKADALECKQLIEAKLATVPTGDAAAPDDVSADQ